MKRTHLQRILALSLSAALLFAAPLNAGAAAAGKAPAAAAVRTAELGTALQGPGADIKPGESLTDVTEEEAQKTADIFSQACPGAEVTLLRGGQPVYYYMISAE